jgi:hypothetical protein
MVVNDDAFILNVRGVFEFIASRLAPTGEGRASALVLQNFLEEMLRTL